MICYSLEEFEDLAKSLDDSDPLSDFRDKFQLPTMADFHKKLGEASGDNENTTEIIYFCTNSLGLPPKSTAKDLSNVLESWRTLGVLSHTKGCSPTEISDLRPKQLLADFIVGANVNEVAVMESLTSNIHTLLSAFYKPKGKKCCILIEKQAFPSDYYAIESQILLRGFEKSVLIELDLRPNGVYLQTEEIVAEISKYAGKLALVWLPGISYLTGQKLDIPKVTRAVHKFCKCPIGWDLVHSVGNVPLALHQWEVDFAAWCGYKYLCGSPGGCAGIFVHEKHHMKEGEYAPSDEYDYSPVLTSWWGHRYSTRFAMTNEMEVTGGADSYQRSCPSMLLNCALASSLTVFAQAGGMTKIAEKSTKLTQFLQDMLMKSPLAKSLGVEIITPSSKVGRGSQLSIKVDVDVEKLYKGLIKRGVICDTRKPCYIRLAPFALYNSYMDVFRGVKIMHEEVEALRKAR